MFSGLGYPDERQGKSQIHCDQIGLLIQLVLVLLGLCEIGLLFGFFGYFFGYFWLFWILFLATLKLIWGYFIGLGINFSYKRSPNILQMFVLFTKVIKWLYQAQTYKDNSHRKLTVCKF